jgi:hypothetical protein
VTTSPPTTTPDSRPGGPSLSPPRSRPARQRATTRATTRRQRAAELLLTGHDTAAVARLLGCSLRSAQRYVAEAQPLLAALRQERLVQLVDRLRHTGHTAAQTLEGIATDSSQPAAARVRAAATLLAETRAYLELGELMERVQTLETRLAELQAAPRAAAPPAAAPASWSPVSLARPEQALTRVTGGVA